MVLHFSYFAKIVDVEIAFLYGDLEKDIYMECPQGMSNNDLVQAARQHHKKTVKILQNSGFVRGYVNPCLYMKKSAKGIDT